MSKKTAKKTEPSQENIRVRAIQWYSNGNLEVHWSAGEVREISRLRLAQLEQDLPNNWEIVHG